MKTVLLAGFDAFGGEVVNPSALATRALDGRSIASHRVVAVELPCVFERAPAVLRDAVREVGPAIVIAVGQTGGRAAIGVERVAINVDDAPIADNAGGQPVDRPIARRGPVGYWSTLPIKAVVAALTGAGIPANVSQSAGTFVCNHVFYSLMRDLRRHPGVRGGFVHVPRLPEQVGDGGAPSMALETIVRALEITVATSIEATRDLRAVGGAVD
ncbi:MAG: pyroglutamyl-peptidase I [Polyangiales bacterium]